MDILHCDLNNFYASVEQVVDPELQKHKYLAVSGNPQARSGIILAKNTAAKQMGVKTGEVIWQAKQKCPDLVCVLPHFEYYVHFSQRVKDIYLQYTDHVESFGMDECWLDVTGSKEYGTPFEIAEKIRNQVKRETGLTISVGVSFTKTFAKLGSDLKKPDATTVIDKNNFKQVVWQLDVGEMLNVGAKTKEKLNKLSIFTLGDLANASERVLTTHFGVVGKKLKRCASGLDDDPVHSIYDVKQVKSVSHGTTTLRDMQTYTDAQTVMLCLCDMVATRLRRYGLQGAVVHLDIRYNDLTHQSKQCHVNDTQITDDIYAVAKRLLKQMWRGKGDKPLRSLTVSVGDLCPVMVGVQASLFDKPNDKNFQLECSVDKIRKKFGYGAITRASQLHNDLLSDKLFSEEDLLPFKRG